MNKLKFISLVASLAFATALAQPNDSDEDDEEYEDDERFYNKTSDQPGITSSMNGSVGYYRVVLNDWEDYPFGGVGFDVGGSGLLLITDIAQFGFLASIGYYSVSASDKDDVKLALSKFYLDVEPKFRLGWEETYADIFLNIEIPLSTKATMKVPGDETSNFDVKDTEANFAVGFFWRYDFFGAGIGKALTGSKNTTIMAAFFLTQKRLAQKQFEIIPSISYGTGKDRTNLNVSLGVEF
jgi:hypothetical protein